MKDCFTREELYELVWAKSALKLGEELGVSNVAIGKACKVLNVPRPAPGYWVQLAVGKAPPRPPLPKLQDGSPTKYTFQPIPDQDRKILNLLRANNASGELDAAMELSIPTDLRGAHKITRHLKSLFDGVSWKNNENFAKFSSEAITVTVSRDQVRRALLLIDGLLWFLEANGSVVVTETGSKDGKGSLSLCNVSYRFEIKEKRRAEKRPMWPSSSHLTQVLIPKGELEIQVSAVGCYGFTRRLSDTPRSNVEARLPELVRWMIVVAPEIVASIKKQEEERRRSEEERKRRLEKAVAINSERKELRAIQVFAHHHHELKRILRFLDYLRSQGRETQDEIELRSIVEGRIEANAARYVDGKQVDDFANDINTWNI